VRCFVAIQLSTEVKRSISAGVAVLKEVVPSDAVRWVKEDNLHLTLRFLGSMEQPGLELIAEQLDAVASGSPGFELWLNAYGVFQNGNILKVLWASVGGDLAPLTSLQAQIEAGVASLSPHTEATRYHPHVTIGRFLRNTMAQGVAISNVLNSQPIEPIAWQVEGFDLMGSQPGPGGPTYTVLQHYSLQG
jgi:2'-5' RNA ligase